MTKTPLKPGLKSRNKTFRKVIVSRSARKTQAPTLPKALDNLIAHPWSPGASRLLDAWIAYVEWQGGGR